MKETITGLHLNSNGITHEVSWIQGEKLIKRCFKTLMAAIAFYDRMLEKSLEME